MLIWQKLDHVFLCNHQIISGQFSNMPVDTTDLKPGPHIVRTILCAKNIDKTNNSSFYLGIDACLASGLQAKLLSGFLCYALALTFQTWLNCKDAFNSETL